MAVAAKKKKRRGQRLPSKWGMCMRGGVFHLGLFQRKVVWLPGSLRSEFLSMAMRTRRAYRWSISGLGLKATLQMGQIRGHSGLSIARLDTWCGQFWLGEGARRKGQRVKTHGKRAAKERRPKGWGREEGAGALLHRVSHLIATEAAPEIGRRNAGAEFAVDLHGGEGVSGCQFAARGRRKMHAMWGRNAHRIRFAVPRRSGGHSECPPARSPPTWRCAPAAGPQRRTTSRGTGSEKG